MVQISDFITELLESKCKGSTGIQANNSSNNYIDKVFKPSKGSMTKKQQ